MAGGHGGLHEPEEHFRQVFEHAGIGMAIVGLDGRFLCVNRRLSADDHAADDAESQRLAAGTCDRVELEKRYRHGDGRWLWVQLTRAVIRDVGGAPRFFVDHLQDIGRCKQAAQRQAWSREVTRQFPNGAIIVFDRDLRYELADGGGLAEVGLSREMLEGKTIFEIFPPAVCALLEGPYRAAFAGQHSVLDVPFADRVYQLHVRPVRADDGQIIAGLAMTQDLTARVRAERGLAASLAEKEVLLKEVHHRVKNNLQIVSSLLSLQAAHLADDLARAALRETQARVHSIALVHEKLYLTKDISRVDLVAYLHDLVATIVQAQSRAAPVRVTGAALAVPIDVAVPCGLVVNELVANALKYACDGEAGGPIRVGVTVEGEQVALVVADAGPGLPPGFDPLTARSLGMHLVRALARQLGGGLEVQSSREGSRFTVRFRMGARGAAGGEGGGAPGEVEA
jgi:two-component sensor histidine kinase